MTKELLELLYRLDSYENPNNWCLAQKCKYSQPVLLEIISVQTEGFNTIEYGFGEYCSVVEYSKILIVGSRKELSQKLKIYNELFELVEKAKNSM